MNPESLHGSRFIHGLWNRQQNSLNDSTEVSQVEEVVRLGWRWQKNLHGLLVYLQSCSHNLVSDYLKVAGKAPKTHKISYE